MAFWGVEVKPGKPYTHVLDESTGRLRLSQATLGNGKSTGKSVLQCNVGEKSPILLCSLIPDKNETCHLELEFEETDDVVFSVLGQRSVHLAGYYLASSGNYGGGEDESESYGEDIAETESGSYDSDEDEYEADFIDDGDIDMFPSSPRRKSNVVIEEILDDEMPANGNSNKRRNKRRNQVSDSDDNASQRQLVTRNGPMIVESEDEDGFPIFSTKTKTPVEGVDGSANFDNGKLDDKKRKILAILSDDGPASTENATHNSEKSKKKKKEKTKDKQRLSKEGFEEESQDVKTKEADLHNEQEETLGMSVENIDEDTVKEGAVCVQSDRKLKKRKKEKTSETGNSLLGEKADGSQTGLDGSTDQNVPVETNNLSDKELGSVESDRKGKSKKKNKKKKSKDADANEKSEQEKGEQVNDDQEKIGGDNKNENAVLTEQSNNNLEKSGKKKNKKNKNRESDSTVKQPSVTKEHEDRTKPFQTRVFGNGFTVEEVSMGKPDGKRASRGNKVSVKYIGKLKNGKIFDSNVGKKPFTFRLGIGEVIKGWDIGVEGMRVGDKRRLTIPPSLGYGSKGVGQIPPNSWLIFDVELVDAK